VVRLNKDKILTDWDPSLNSQLDLPFPPMGDPRIKVLFDYGGLKIVQVEGKDIREGKEGEIDFTEGGNHSKYDFVPADEIWLDDWLLDPEQASELWPTLFHELIEYKLMGADGMKYADAHKEASKQELEARINPRDIKKRVDKAAKDAIDALGLRTNIGRAQTSGRAHAGGPVTNIKGTEKQSD
jgi:hypothetical protein